MFHPLIVGFDSLTEIIGAIFIYELCDDGNGLIGFHFGRNFGGVYNYLSVEDFLLDTLIEVVGDGSNKYALCEIGDFGSRNKTIELFGDRSGPAVALPSGKYDAAR